ncbi:MAG: class I SAM-dependent methyltransferase [Desulfuromonadaceae bacterium]|nr:class I SAM-dependent methyltransferase [Desulfuromonadaceae bacterium]MDD5104802.1 class I SAM-dependent methyltransferase [Desulfuromonadaceae bacterium]
MSNTKSYWQSEESATAFLKGVRGAIPAAGLQLEIINHIVQSWCPQPRCIVDLGCGDGILGRFLLANNPETHVTFVDFSAPMLEAVRKQVGDDERATIVTADFSSPAWSQAINGNEPFDIVVSGFAIHHLPHTRKHALYSEIFRLLAPGGVFLNLEHVASETAPVENLFDEFFIDHLHRFDGVKCREEIAQAHYSRPDRDENILASVDEQTGWLRSIGFIDVDCFFKTFELALFGGRKQP